MEECGLSITIEKVSRTWGFTKRDLHLVGITYLAHCDTEHIKLSDEHTDYFWQSKEDILSGSFPDWLKEEFLSL
jgi:hypothetical protein